MCAVSFASASCRLTLPNGMIGMSVTDSCSMSKNYQTSMSLRSFGKKVSRNFTEKKNLNNGKTNQRTGVDPDLDCDDFERGEPEGYCDGMGHYHCDECKWRSQESINQKHEDFMRHQNHKKEWPKIKAIVIDSGEEVMVDDHAIDFFGTSYYNMWHNTANGMTYHDDDLEFIDERLQKV